MYIRSVIRVRGSAYVNIPMEIKRKMNFNFGDDVAIGVTPEGTMYVIKLGELLSSEAAGDVTKQLRKMVYGE